MALGLCLLTAASTAPGGVPRLKEEAQSRAGPVGSQNYLCHQGWPWMGTQGVYAQTTGPDVREDRWRRKRLVFSVGVCETLGEHSRVFLQAF